MKAGTTMRHKHFVLILSLIILAGSAAWAQEYDLINKFEEGNTDYLDTTVEMTGTTKMGEMKMPLENGVDITLVFNTVSVDENGTAQVEIMVDKYMMTNSMMGDKPVNVMQMFDMGGKSIMTEVTPKGESSGGNLASLGLENMGSMGQKNSTTQLPWPQLPEEPVSVGSTWSEEQIIPLEGSTKPIIKSVTYTLSEVTEEEGQQLARITTESTINEEDVEMSPPIPQPGGQGSVEFNYNFQKYKANGTGEMVFNIDSGKLISIQEKMEMLIDMGGQANVNQADFPSTFVMDYTVNTQSEFLQEKPE